MTASNPFCRATILLAIGALASAQDSLGAPLPLSDAPAGTTSRAPAPNVIISVDDSGSMGPTGMATLRNALLKTFTPANVPDGSIRLAWQAMTGCFTIPSGGDCNNQNMMRVLDSSQRNNFTDWVGRLAVRGSTPSHRMFLNAGEYLKNQSLGINSPWASIPGTREAPLLSCRKSYEVFMTDGGWNDWTNNMAPQIGNADGQTRTLPDSTVYDAASASSLPYRDGFGDARLPTLADMAFYYWATDLQPGIPNNVPKRTVRSSDESFSSGGVTRVVTPYWNPRNDPASWQHMITYTVGFNTAANWNRVASPKFGSDTWTGGDYDALMTGRAGWSNAITGTEDTRMPELWHMALNSRGKYVPAPDADALTAAFKDILNTINGDQAAPTTSLTGSALTTRSASTAFTAGYLGANWTGYVTAYDVAAGSGQVSSTGAWGTIAGSSPAKPVSTATLLDATGFSPAARVVLSSDGNSGIAWQWANLTSDQKAALNTLNGTADTAGEDRLNYVRGDRSKEVAKGGSFRNRDSRQGDIVNSKLWFLAGKPAGGYADSTYANFRRDNTSRASMIYVGGNDGMLHGFAAADGSEKIAYVPQGLNATLSELASTNYSHRYYVDGSPFSGDVKIGTTWKTYLAGFLGAGGRGYFVLDATNPASFSSASPAALVVMDKTAAVDADVGHIVSEPAIDPSNASFTQQITKMNNGRWALIMGNGYNSANEQAVLLVQYLDGAKELLKLKAGTAGGNGLGAPRLVDLNGDKVPDVAYAGDLKGNLWKFDLSSPDQSATAPDWKVAFGGSPLYVAKDAANNVQPITAAPVWLPHPDGGVMVVFGTGRNLTDADRSDTSTQSIYGVHDSTAVNKSSTNLITLSGGGSITAGRTALVQQTSSSASTGTADASTARLWTLSANAVNYTGTNAKKGWYMDLPDAGERVLSNLQWFDGQLVDAASTVPNVGGNATEETCTPTVLAGRSYLNTMNALTGAAPKSQIYAYVSASVSANDKKNASRIESSLRYGVKSQTVEKSVCPPGQSCTGRILLGKIGLQPTWRQLQ